MNNAAKKEDPTLKHNTVCLGANKLQDATFGMRVLHCIIPQSHTLEDILEPTYWKHNAHIVAPFTKIYCDFEDGRRFLMLNVIANDRTWAKVEVLIDTKSGQSHDEEVEELQEAGDEEYQVVWKGPAHKWTVVRKQDGETIQKGIKQKEEAQGWLAQFKASLSR